jgi:hypothetical protein
VAWCLVVPLSMSPEGLVRGLVGRRGIELRRRSLMGPDCRSGAGRILIEDAGCWRTTVARHRIAHRPPARMQVKGWGSTALSNAPSTGADLGRARLGPRAAAVCDLGDISKERDWEVGIGIE